MSRSLHEMKVARGGHCIQCGVDIMSPIHTDHTFCNDCWNNNMAHEYNPWIDMEGEEGCNECDEPQHSPTHKPSPVDPIRDTATFERIMERFRLG